jgi:hypothetical protein
MAQDVVKISISMLGLTGSEVKITKQCRALTHKQKERRRKCCHDCLCEIRLQPNLSAICING